MTRLSAPLVPTPRLSTPSMRAPHRHATPGALPATLATRSHGFTLVELAMVLVILALLGSALLVPLGSRIEARDRQLSLDRLHDIQHALIGFALIHGRLPCPSSEADPTSPLYGLEDAPPCSFASEGRLPWRSLAMPATDAWGNPRTSASDDWAGHWRYRVDPPFAAGPITAATAPAANLQIRAHDGSRITTTDSQAVAIIYSTGPNRRPDGLNASYAASGAQYQAGVPTPDFDDLLLWIGRPLLIARLAQGGGL